MSFSFKAESEKFTSYGSKSAQKKGHFSAPGPSTDRFPTYGSKIWAELRFFIGSFSNKP